MEGRRITITGIVQGVGFRPFVYNLAIQHQLRGYVLNHAGGVEIIVLGPVPVIQAFIDTMHTAPPPLAQIEQIHTEPLPPDQQQALAATLPPVFTIAASTILPTHPPEAGSVFKHTTFVPVSPDVALCDACLSELLNPADRRYRYPFINCTNCGPRYTIIRDTPYDRPTTTMADFVMCAACRAEYEDPANRRFHAQPNACAACGPQLSYIAGSNPAETLHRGESALAAAQAALLAGQIVAIKGIGGFHLACDATHDDAVQRLRVRKGRVDKPFGVMAASITVAESVVRLTAAATRTMTTPARPIVLLPKRLPSALSPHVAPGNHRLGVMLPYSPLHHLLFRPYSLTPAPDPTIILDDTELPLGVLVMTSGNLSEEPIAIDNDEALARLSGLADAFLLHDRPIHIPCDDSVVAHPAAVARSGTEPAHDAAPILIRRSRGFAPAPLPLPFDVPPLLAVGAELKNVLCVARNRHAFLSQHIGDLTNLETLHAFERTVDHLRRLLRVEPERLACDLHPAYLSSRWARELAQASGLPLIETQHHHAHVAALMAEHQLPAGTTVLGVAMDGTGYGPDGAIWGGEFLVASYADYRRIGHLRPMPLPGGDAAIRRPYRIALAALWAAGIPWHETLPPVAACPPAEQRLLRQQLERNFNCVPTSSMGRLFDTVAALAGLRQTISYEAQGAVELEALAAGGLDAATYPFHLALQPRFDESAKRTMDRHTGDYHTGDAEIHAGRISALSTLWKTPHDHVKFELDMEPMLHALVSELLPRFAARPGQPPADVSHFAARFHHTIAAAIEAGCVHMQQEFGLKQVALTGGVFQNATLLALTVDRLTRAGFETVTHRRVPPNDGGLALGQAAIAAQAQV